MARRLPDGPNGEQEIVYSSRDISERVRIERELEYPGQIRVNVIRETRSTEYAK